MPISQYLADLRSRVGHDLLLLPAVAVICHDAHGRLLLVRDRDSGGWGLPAGAIDPGESPREAAQRELHEESGVECASLQLVAALGGAPFRHTYPNGDVVEYSLFVFSGAAVGGAGARARDHEEIAEVRFFSRDAAPKLELPYSEDLLWGGSV